MIDLHRMTPAHPMPAPAPACDLRQVVSQATYLVPADRRGDLLVILETNAPLHGPWDEVRLLSVLAELLASVARSTPGASLQVLLRRVGMFAHLVICAQGKSSAADEHSVVRCRRLLEPLGGQLWATHRHGLSSTFVVSLPL